MIKLLYSIALNTSRGIAESLTVHLFRFLKKNIRRLQHEVR
nr:MAG TPA: hypothetical protein [Bacteriophage sp.]